MSLKSDFDRWIAEYLSQHLNPWELAGYEEIHERAEKFRRGEELPPRKKNGRRKRKTTE